MDGDIYLQHYNDETNFTINNINVEEKDLVESFKDDLAERKSYFINFTEYFSNNGFGNCIIKEELIISDESDNEYDIENYNTANDEQYLPNDLWDAAGPQNEGNIFTDIRVKAEEKLTQESPTTSTHNIRSTKEIVEQSRKAIKEHCKTYCPKCKKKKPVILRITKCLTCDTPLTYICEKCQKLYITYTDLRYHVKLKDIGLPYDLVRPNMFGKFSCSKCGKTFMWVQNKRRHEMGCGTEPRFKCAHCPYKASFEYLLSKHLLTHEKKREMYPCPTCGKNYTNKKALRRHQLVYCDKQKLLQCAHCDKKVYRKDELINHLRCQHSFPIGSFPRKKKCGLNFNDYRPIMFGKFNCSKCGKNYTNKKALRRHQLVYCDKQKLLQCAHCDKKVYRKDGLINHLRRKHSFPIDNFPCKKNVG